MTDTLEQHSEDAVRAKFEYLLNKYGWNPRRILKNETIGCLEYGNYYELHVQAMWEFVNQFKLAAHNEWQLIETAPKDKRILLARISEYGLCGISDGYYDKHNVWVWPYIRQEPTHWMPLPKSSKQP